MISQISKFQGPITQKLVQNFTFTVLKVCYTANAASLKSKQACSYETSDGDGAAVLAVLISLTCASSSPLSSCL